MRLGTMVTRLAAPALALGIAAGPLTLLPPAGSTAGAAAPPMLIAADYFGEANPFNFWNSDLSSAKADFARIKATGFNTVGLVVPWGEFQTGVLPARYNQQAFNRLDSLIAQAKAAGLQVILRLGYAYDNDPYDQLPGNQRAAALFGNSKVRQSWLDYISKVHASVARFSNVRGAYLSWEDYWAPIYASQSAKSEARRHKLAVALGFRGWAHSHYSLDQINQAYGTSYTSWSQVSTPSFTSSAYRLMLQFQDDVLVNELFEPALHRYPGLTMEARVDKDMWQTNDAGVQSYEHTSQLQLPGTTVTGLYFSPYMNDPSTSHVETAQQGVQALNTTLDTVASQSGGRHLVIYEYEFVSNAPPVAADPALANDQVVPFLRQSVSTLRSKSRGYALFTYRDFDNNGLYNPSFALGTSGWITHGRVSTTQPRGSASYATVQKGAAVAQPVDTAGFTSKPVTVSFSASASSGSATITVLPASAPAQTVHLRSGWHSYQFQVPRTQFGEGRVTLSPSATVKLTDVHVYNFTQLGDVLSTTGQPGFAYQAVKSMNQQLAKGS